MSDVTENGLRSAVKALVDVVAPSVAATDPLANEQLRLVVEYLQFVRGRLDHLYDRDRFELDHHLAMARALADLAPPLSPTTAGLLDRTLQAGAQSLARVGASTVELKAASAGLAAAVREIVREAASFNPDLRLRVERCVLDGSDRRITFERAWYLPLGFDPAPGEVAPLSEVLARGAAIEASAAS
jgi:hypothetical protein